jgi:type IV pilus assembly protein PilB
MASDGALRERLQQKASFTELYRAAVAGGMRPMLRVALDRVRSGQTTLQEVERVLGGIHDDMNAGDELATALRAVS